MVKKSETWEFLPNTILAIVCLFGIPLYIYYNRYTVPHPIAALILSILWGIVGIISRDIVLQRADLEKWVYDRLQSEWKFRKNPLSAHLFTPSFVSLVASIILILFIILIYSSLILALYFGTVLWINCDGDISKFGDNISNFTSVILVFIFMSQSWIFYRQYRHMQQPLFKAPLLWTLSKSKSDTDCCILFKNGGTVPLFDISYHVTEVLVKDIWGFKITKSEEISKDFLPRLGGGSEKEIFGKPTEEFKEMRLAVYLSAKTLDGHSTRLFFYKAPEAVDFRLAVSSHT